VDAVVALYEPGGVLVALDGLVTAGHAPAIRDALSQLAAMRPRMTMNLTRVVRTPTDLAVVYNDGSCRRWTRRAV
jgi:hypothetical protein